VAHQLLTLAVAAVVVMALALKAQAALVAVVMLVQLEHLELLIVVVVAAVVLRQAVLAAQASSSFHTQAQLNYLVVELLPNQAVTLFTHSHLLAHLALCHL
jgi:hypothetical protein